MPKKARRKTRARPQRVQAKKLPVVSRTQGRRGLSRGTAIIALILNIIIPGIGTLIAGMITVGVLQLILYLIGIFMVISITGFVVGFPLALIVWVWALITGIRIVQKSS